MLRFIFYIILTYIIYFVLKHAVNSFRKKPPVQNYPPNYPPQKEKETLDKSKIVDADFEEIK